MLTIGTIVAECINHITEHIVVHVAVLAHFGFKHVDILEEVLERNELFKSDTRVFRHRFADSLDLLEVTVDLDTVHAYDNRLKPCINRDSVFVVRAKREELISP